MDLDSILEAISNMSGLELEHVREAVERRRERLKQSTVLQRRKHGPAAAQLRQRYPAVGAQSEPQNRHDAWTLLVLPLSGGRKAAHPLRWQDRRPGGRSGREARRVERKGMKLCRLYIPEEVHIRVN